jgi:restriction endonuclease S subunit
MNDIALPLIRLGEITEVRSGFPFRGAIDALPPGNVMVLQVRDVTVNGSPEWPRLLRKELPKSRPPEYLRKGDVLITTRGRRNDALALPSPPGEAVAATNLFVIRILDCARLLPGFLAWQINQKPAQDFLMAAATGSHILNLTRPALEALPIALPSLEQQQRLVDLANSIAQEQTLLTRLIENRQQQMDALASAFLTGKTIV